MIIVSINGYSLADGDVVDLRRLGQAESGLQPMPEHDWRVGGGEQRNLSLNLNYAGHQDPSKVTWGSGYVLIVVRSGKHAKNEGKPWGNPK